jgi:ABC-type branched-subunit amino acid transport system substrate-binding protein
MKIMNGLKFPAVLAGVALGLALQGGLCVRVAAQDPLTQPESRGKQIYVKGTSPAGREILAYIGEASLEVPGSAMACGNCHGLDGNGKPEGGVDPSNVTWEALTKPYEVLRPNGRKHPAYTERALELAITRGVDPAGNKLQNVMPRYQMSRDDLADLVLYLKRLAKDRDPGISESRIVIGMVGPPKGTLSEMGQAVKAATSAFFEEINSQGGIYNRRFELKFVDSAGTPPASRASVERFLKDEQVFALTGSFIAGSEKEFVALVEQNAIPLIGPFTLYPQVSFPLNRQTFYLLSGLDGQARALVDFATRKPEARTSGFTVVYSQSEINAIIVSAIVEQAKKNGLRNAELYSYVSGRLDMTESIRSVKQIGREMVFFIGSSEEGMAFMREAGKLSWFPSLYLPGAYLGRDIFDAPLGFNNRVFLSFPTSPADQTAEGIKEFRALVEKYKLPGNHLASQIQAYSAAKILVEGMKRAGRDVSQEKLILALESLHRFDTGLTPAITYGPNRRIGAQGAYVISVDLEKKQFAPASNWIGID